MKYLFFVLCMVSFSLGQYSENKVTGDDATFTTTVGSWVSVRSGTITQSSGLGILTPLTEAFSGANLPGVYTIGKFYKTGLSARIQAGGGEVLQVRSFGGSSHTFTPTGTQQVFTFTDDVNSAGGTGMQIVNFSGIPDGSIYEIDNIFAFEKFDTLWTDLGQADDTGSDTTKTLTEAFQTRGTHSGGNFITISGTYNESFIINESFTKWEGIGVIVNGVVDFNSVTATVEGIRFSQQPLNDENITYTSGAGHLRRNKYLNTYNTFLE